MAEKEINPNRRGFARRAVLTGLTAVAVGGYLAQSQYEASHEHPAPAAQTVVPWCPPGANLPPDGNLRNCLPKGMAFVERTVWLPAGKAFAVDGQPKSLSCARLDRPTSVHVIGQQAVGNNELLFAVANQQLGPSAEANCPPVVYVSGM